MSHQTVLQGIVTPMDTVQKHHTTVQLVLFGTDGLPMAAVKPAAALANSTATDVAGIVASHNTLLARLRDAGVLKTS